MTLQRSNTGKPKPGTVYAVLILALLPKALPADTLSFVNPVFLPVMPQLKRKAPRIPVLLPASIARQQQYGQLTADLGGSHLGYTVTLSNTKSRQEGRDHPNRMYWVCAVAGQVIVSKRHPHIGKRVFLAGGIAGWFQAAGTNPSAPFATLVWDYKTGDYSIGLTHATQAELVSMANSALQHPIQFK